MTPDSDPDLDAKILQIFLQLTLFCKPIKLTLSEVPPPSVIHFLNPLMTPDLDPNSYAKILQIFLLPYFAKIQVKVQS